VYFVRYEVMGGRQPRNGVKKELAQAKIDVAEYEDSPI
jgi:hypothetical protein